MEFIINNLLWTEGLVVFIVASIGVGIGWRYSRMLLWVSILFLVFGIYFFRNPERACPAVNDEVHQNIVVAPADGKVVEITQGLRGSEYAQKLSIFLSLWDVHVNRAPVGGMVEDIRYSPGLFTLAFQTKSSEINERNDIVIRRYDGSSVMMRQIAGTIARRIRCWIKPGDRLEPCSRVGMIRFGSRVDLFLPPHVKIHVQVGDQVYGGLTILGFFDEMKNDTQN